MFKIMFPLLACVKFQHCSQENVSCHDRSMCTFDSGHRLSLQFFRLSYDDVMTTFVYTEEQVTHIEEDQFVPGNLLCADRPSL